MYRKQQVQLEQQKMMAEYKMQETIGKQIMFRHKRIEQGVIEENGKILTSAFKEAQLKGKTEIQREQQLVKKAVAIIKQKESENAMRITAGKISNASFDEPKVLVLPKMQSN